MGSQCLLVLLGAVLLAAGARSQDPDADGDGLSDFREQHKYRTDPRQRDSDGDGVPDGDWNERREFTYSVRAVIQVRPNYDLASLDDDYQDARLLYECPEYAEIEFVLYPLNTCGEAIAGRRGWRRRLRGMESYLAPGVTTNWDAAMRADLVRRLRKAGIDVDRLTDAELVRKASHWALEHSASLGKTCVWAVEFDGDEPRIHSQLQGKFENNKGAASWSAQDQFEHELYGKGMYENGTRGTCTTSANYLSTVLRALGVPTRMIVTIPVVDASDPSNVEMARNRLTHHRVGRQVVRGVERLAGSFAAHIYNEVWVDGRWRRLNYDRLGQNILDSGFMGLMVKVHTFNDLADAGLGSGWGVLKRLPSDVFRHNNPYTAITLSDLFGPHGELDNPDDDHRQLTIAKAYWFHSRERPAMIGADWERARDRRAGHLLVEVGECREGDGPSQYTPFWRKASKSFELRAPDAPAVRATSIRAWWVDADRKVTVFYLHIPPGEFGKLKPKRSYRLTPVDEAEAHRWAVADDVRLTRPPVR